MEWNRLEIKHIRAIEVTRIKQCYNNVPCIMGRRVNLFNKFTSMKDFKV